MKRAVLTGILLLSVMGTAEAGVTQWFKNSVVYLYRPIPALYNYGSNLIHCFMESTVTFTVEVVGNLNANPANEMKPIFPDPLPQPDPVPQEPPI